MQKDLSKLRPFDLEAWRKGAKVCCESGGSMAREMVSLIVATGMAYCLRMAPLGWLDGHPVYGDHWVYRTAIGDCVQALEMGCPALAIAAGNVRWPTKGEIRLAQIAKTFFRSLREPVYAEERPKVKIIELRIDGRIVDERRVPPDCKAAIAFDFGIGSCLLPLDRDYHS